MKTNISSTTTTPNQTGGPVAYTEQKPYKKLEYLRRDGWGYQDTKMVVDESRNVVITGNRYMSCGEKLPYFVPWAEKTFGLDVNQKFIPNKTTPIAPPVINQGFLDDIKTKGCEVSFDDEERIFHSHGHTLKEIYDVKFGSVDRGVDCVLYADSSDMVEFALTSAIKNNCVLVPFGGGTNVTKALVCPVEEKRMIVSLDLSKMNHVKWVDRKNMLACVEAGITGQDLEVELGRYGVCCGHEPDSVEFSTLGGWISTRASGMKKNVYGNIDDIVINIKMITPRGIITKKGDWPRISSGPDLNHIILGSEGNFGVVTEAVIRLREKPEINEYESYVFPEYANGINFMFEVSKSKTWPAGLRLVDNLQFHLGLSMRSAPKSKLQELAGAFKTFMLTEIKKFDVNKMVLATIVFEGTRANVDTQKKVIHKIATKFGGLKGGAENGRRGYFLTYTIAYLRDNILDYGMLAESLETAVSWEKIPQVIQRANERFNLETKKHGVKLKPFFCSRITQIYESGVCVYIYFAFMKEGLEKPAHVFEEIEKGIRDEILKAGGSISHHHGIGKIRRKFLEESINSESITLLKHLKQYFDPGYNLGLGALIQPPAELYQPKL